MKIPVPFTHHCVVQCQECDFVYEDYKKAHKEGANRVKETGHTVDVNQGYLIKMTDLGLD